MVNAMEFSSAIKSMTALFPGFYFDTMLGTENKYSVCLVYQQDFIPMDMINTPTDAAMLKKFKDTFDAVLLKQDAVKYELRQKDKEIERLKEVERALLSELEKYKDFATYYRMHQAMLHNKQVTEVR